MSKPIVSYSVKDINGNTLTCLKSKVPQSIDLDKMILTEEQKAQCFLERCRAENGYKVCTKEGNPAVLTHFKRQ